jgi:hypothetical protein
MLEGETFAKEIQAKKQPATAGDTLISRLAATFSQHQRSFNTLFGILQDADFAPTSQARKGVEETQLKWSAWKQEWKTIQH